MFDFFKKIDEFLQILNFHTNLLNEINFWDDGGEIFPLPFEGFDFSSIELTRQFIEPIETIGYKNNLFNEILCRKANFNTLKAPDTEKEFFNFFINRNNTELFSPFSVKDKETEVPNNLKTAKTNFQSLIFQNNFNAENILNEENKSFLFRKNQNNENQTISKNSIQNIPEFDFNQNLNENDIDFIGETLAKYIKQACTNRSVADAY